MTHQRLSELLHERVADVSAADHAEAAWQAGARVRRRRTAVAVGAVAVTAAVVGGGLAALGRPDGSGAPGPATSVPTATPSTAAPRVGATPAPASPGYAGTSVWWAPTVDEEDDLPVLTGGPLPTTIDLTAWSTVTRLDSAVAAFALPSGEDVLPIREVLLVGPVGGRMVIDVSRLEPVSDGVGNTLSALTPTSLSPDGRHLFFAQPRSLEIYRIATRTWSSIPTPLWRATGARWTGDDTILVPSSAEPGVGGTVYGLDGSRRGVAASSPAGSPGLGDVHGPAEVSPAGELAQSRYLAHDVPGKGEAAPEAVVVEGAHPSVLAVPPEYGRRPKGCCPVAGWLDADTVLFWSRGDRVLLLAWRVGTPDLQVVTDVVGGDFAQASIAPLAGR